jgi:hypothetical protein
MNMIIKTYIYNLQSVFIHLRTGAGLGLKLPSGGGGILYI